MLVKPISPMDFEISAPVEISQAWRDFSNAIAEITEKLTRELDELFKYTEKGIENRRSRAIRRAKRQKEKERRKRLKEGAKRGD